MIEPTTVQTKHCEVYGFNVSWDISNLLRGNFKKKKGTWVHLTMPLHTKTDAVLPKSH